MTKKIELAPHADPAHVMSVIARTAESLGYRFDQHDARSATAHEGGKNVRGNVTATRARLGVELEPDVVKIKSETSGAAYVGAANTPFFMIRIGRRYRKFAAATADALRSADLA